jgi:hypothetical protein
VNGECVVPASPSPGVESSVGGPARRAGIADVLRWVLLACWLFILLSAPILGERSAPLRQLESGLATDQVHTVAVTQGLATDSTGYGTQELHWRQGWHRYHAEVVMVSPGGDYAQAQEEGVAIRRGFDIAGELLRHNPQVDITRVTRRHSGGEVYGWQVPLQLGVFALAAAVGTLALLIAGPQPWRATRWAWFWLMTSPVGTLLFFILAGPTPPLRPPRVPGRRLTGGWGFLLSVLLTSLLAPLAAVFN